MGQHPNVALMRRGYDAFANQDVGTLTELFADDIVWHNPGRNHFSGDRKGRDEVFAFFLELGQFTEGSLQLEVHDIVANDEHALAMVRGNAKAGGKTLDNGEVHVFHIKDGKVTEFWAFSGDQYASDEFFG